MKALLISLTLLVGFQTSAAEPINTKPQTKWTYPGARDDEELVVQTELVPPAEKVDREGQAENIRNNLFKKNEKETTNQE